MSWNPVRTGEDQRVLLRRTPVSDFALFVFNFDLVNTPIDEINDRVRITSVLIVLLGNLVEFVGHLVGTNIPCFSLFREITIQRGDGRGVAVVIDEKVWLSALRRPLAVCSMA